MLSLKEIETNGCSQNENKMAKLQYLCKELNLLYSFESKSNKEKKIILKWNLTTQMET